MKRVLIATPALDQKVDCYFVHSLCESIKLGLENDLDIKCVFLANESILPMARNELFKLAYDEQYDMMVFIDDDEYWDEKGLIELLLSGHDVCCLPVVNKNDKSETFNTWFTDRSINNGYIEIDRTGTGFLMMTSRVIRELFASNQKVTFRGKVLSNICEYQVIGNDFIGEDIALIEKIKELGYKIYANINYTVSHIGNKMYQGDFKTSNKF